MRVPPPLTGPYAAPPARDRLVPLPATVNLVRSQVKALLMSSPAYGELPAEERRRLAGSMVKIAAYAAELIRDDWYQSERIGQRPVVRYRRELAPVATAQAADFTPAAANQIGRVTQETLRAIAFPTFVADLINGTFNAIIGSSLRQMEAFTRLLEDVSKTVDQYEADSVNDNMARDWLVERYPDRLQVRRDGDGARVGLREGAAEGDAPSWGNDLGLGDVGGMDGEELDETLVPAARRRLAQNRLQMLSTLMLMGINRIVVTGGRIRATMQFHIDTTDRAHEERASDLDARVAASGGVNMGFWAVSASMSVAYVSSARSESDSEINVDANLTGEVEIQFKSDYFPLNRFAPSGTIARIQGNTAVPEENAPNPQFAPAVQALPTARSPRQSRLPALRTVADTPPQPAAAPPLPQLQPPPQAGGAPNPAADGAPNPATGDAPNPATGGAPNPAADGAPNPATGGAPNPATGGAPNPAAGGAPNPATGGAPNPAAGGAPNPADAVGASREAHLE